MMKKLLLVAGFVLMCCCVSAQQHSFLGESFVLCNSAEFGVSAEMGDFVAYLQEFSTTVVGRVICFLLLLVFLPFVLGVYLLVPAFVVFLVMFVFNFDALRRWFNKKAGVEIVSFDRVDKRFWRFALFLCLFAISIAVICHRPVAAILVVPAMLLYCHMRVRKRVTMYGSRKAAWFEIIYVLFAGYAVMALCMLFFWAIIIFFGVKLLTEPSSSSSSSGDSGYTCDNCIHHDGSEDWCTARKMRAYKSDKACGALKLTR